MRRHVLVGRPQLGAGRLQVGIAIVGHGHRLGQGFGSGLGHGDDTQGDGGAAQ